MMRLAIALAVMIWAGAAGADLYRWVDPESGSVKYSNYPPPWYGDDAKQRRAPKVQVIAPGRDSVAKPELPVAPAEGSVRRDEGRKALDKPARGETR